MLNKRELASSLKVSISMIDKLLSQGMPHLKIGKAVRFDLQEVLKWLKERK